MQMIDFLTRRVNLKATHDQQTPSGDGDMSRLTMPLHKAAPEALDAIRCLEAMERHGIAWHGLMGDLMATNESAAASVAPLPSWAKEFLQRHASSAWASYAGMFLLIRTYLESSAGLSSDCVFEIWTPAGVRLDGQFLFAEHANGALSEHRKQHSGAFIMQMNVGAALVEPVPRDDLLPSLLGDVLYLQTKVQRGTGERFHVVRDSSGRAITVTTMALMRSPVFARMSEFARSTVVAVPQ